MEAKNISDKIPQTSENLMYETICWYFNERYKEIIFLKCKSMLQKHIQFASASRLNIQILIYLNRNKTIKF